jgi:hypothetical protein
VGCSGAPDSPDSPPCAAALVARPRPRPPRRRRRRADVPVEVAPSPSPPDSGFASARSAFAGASAPGAASFVVVVDDDAPLPDRDRRRRVPVEVVDADPSPVSFSCEGFDVERAPVERPLAVVGSSVRSAAGASPFSDDGPAPCETVPGRFRPRPPRRRRLRAGAAVPLVPSAEPVSGRSAPAVPVGATADSIPASLTKHPFLSGHAGRTGHATTTRGCRGSGAGRPFVPSRGRAAPRRPGRQGPGCALWHEKPLSPSGHRPRALRASDRCGLPTAAWLGSDSAAPAAGSTGSSGAGTFLGTQDTWLARRGGEPGPLPQMNRRTRMFSSSPTAMKSAIRALPP